MHFYGGVVGTALAAVRENLPTSRRGKFCVSRVVGDADPYELRRKLTAALASFGKGGGFCEAKDGGLEIENNHFFGGGY